MDAVLFEELDKQLARARDKHVIVEGARDEASLMKLGFSNVSRLSGPLFKVVEQINDKEVVLLTDLDVEGRFLFSKLSNDLAARGVRIDNSLRQLLFRTELRQIEGLASFLQRRGFVCNKNPPLGAIHKLKHVALRSSL